MTTSQAENLNNVPPEEYQEYLKDIPTYRYFKHRQQQRGFVYDYFESVYFYQAFKSDLDQLYNELEEISYDSFIIKWKESKFNLIHLSVYISNSFEHAPGKEGYNLGSISPLYVSENRWKHFRMIIYETLIEFISKNSLFSLYSLYTFYYTQPQFHSPIPLDPNNIRILLNSCQRNQDKSLLVRLIRDNAIHIVIRPHKSSWGNVEYALIDENLIENIKEKSQSIDIELEKVNENVEKTYLDSKDFLENLIPDYLNTKKYLVDNPITSIAADQVDKILESFK